MLLSYFICCDKVPSNKFLTCTILQEFLQFRLNRNKMLRSRTNQILLPFSFWNEIKPREGKNIYEMRRYTLKVSAKYYD